MIMAMWGLAFGGAATLFQTAAAITSGRASDVAQPMIITLWNGAIAGGGMLGGILLENSGAAWMPRSALVLLSLALLIAFSAKTSGFARAR
jgi:predicted MFS family arabinose efflux permease